MVLFIWSLREITERRTSSTEPIGTMLREARTRIHATPRELAERTSARFSHFTCRRGGRVCMRMHVTGPLRGVTFIACMLCVTLEEEKKRVKYFTDLNFTSCRQVDPVHGL